MLPKFGRKRMRTRGEVKRRTFLSAVGAGAFAGCSGLGGSTPDSSRQWTVDPLSQEKLVGAHYYLWYQGSGGYGAHTDRPWLEHSPHTPELGQYDSGEATVVNQQIKWALEHGVNWFIITVGAPSGPNTDVLEQTFLEAELSEEINWAVLTGFDHLPVTDETGNTIIHDERNVSAARRYLEYYADRYFHRSNYVKFEGRPVVFDFSTPSLTGDLVSAFERITEPLPEDPYLVANAPGLWHPPALAGFDDIFEVYDAISFYAVLPPNDRIRANYTNHWYRKMREWLFRTHANDINFLPTIMPSFNDRQIKWRGRTHHDPFLLSDAEFRSVCERSLETVDPDLDAVVLTSWNEFPEGSAIEPAEEYGTARLETVEETIGQRTVSTVDPRDYGRLTLQFDEAGQPPGDSRPLSFNAVSLALKRGGEDLEQFDIGVPGERLIFVEGAYLPRQTGTTSFRWLGGPTRRTEVFIPPEVTSARTAVLEGYPLPDLDLSATVQFEGVRTDSVSFRSEGMAAYEVSLEPA